MPIFGIDEVDRKWSINPVWGNTTMKYGQKNLRSILFVVALTLGLAACGGGGTSGGSGSTLSSGDHSLTSPTTPTTPTSPTTPTEPTTPTTPTTPTSGAATISWSVPTERTDGAALKMSELGGYLIYYGTNSSELTQVVRVEDPYQTQYTFNLPGGTYYFRVSAYDSEGIQSSKSNQVSRSI